MLSVNKIAVCMNRKESRLTVRFNQQTMDKVEQFAAANQTSLSEVIRQALMSYSTELK
jgi:metal-responsive CopG/Arc/MetJ family transcriptional regulator